MMMIDFHAHLDRDPLTKEYKVAELLEDMKANGITKRVVSTFTVRRSPMQTMRS